MFLNFKHNNHWHRIIVGFDLGSCNPICFQTRGLKGAKMNISANYMAILFFIWFDVFINEFLSKIPFRNMHGNYYHFWHKRGKKGGRFQMSNFFVFHPILRHFLNILMGYRWAIKKIGILFFKEVWRESKFWNFTYLEDTEKKIVVQFCCVLFLWIYCIESFLLYADRFPLSLSVLGCLKKNGSNMWKKCPN